MSAISDRKPGEPAKASDLMIEALEREGVEYIFGIPGEENLDLLESLRHSKIKLVVTRHEQGAGFMADGYARTSGKPGVCFIITGPGMTNITTAMGQAYADSIPMLVISSVQSRSQLGGGRGKLHELPNQGAMIAGVAAFSHTLMSAAELPGVLARAFALFQAGRPRPVHIEIPLDVLVENADALLGSEPVSVSRAGAAPSAVKQMSRLLAAAKRPLILAGGGAIDAAPELTQLAETLGAPGALTINAKCMLASRHPLLVGSTQTLVATRALVAEADVVLAIGTELAETDYDVTFAGGFEIPGALLRIDIDADQTVRNYTPQVALVADAQIAAKALLDDLANKPLAARQSDWGANRVARLWADLEPTWDAATRAQTLFLNTVLQELPDAVLVGDSTQPVYTGNPTLNLYQPRRWFNSSTGYGTLGYALPAAIGAWLGRGDGAPVVCLIGDGGLQFTLPELASAVEARTPVIVLLWNNQGYEEIKKYMVNRAIEPVGVDIYTPDFIGVAKALGCAAESIQGIEHLRSALRAAADRQGPTLIEIDQGLWMKQVAV